VYRHWTQPSGRVSAYLRLWRPPLRPLCRAIVLPPPFLLLVRSALESEAATAWSWGCPESTISLMLREMVLRELPLDSGNYRPPALLWVRIFLRELRLPLFMPEPLVIPRVSLFIAIAADSVSLWGTRPLLALGRLANRSPLTLATGPSPVAGLARRGSGLVDER
jgi:hypothetical protein